MSNMTKDNNEPYINASAGRSEKFHKATKRLSDYLYSLNLPREVNDTLVHLMLDEVTAAEHDAFLYAIIPPLLHEARQEMLDKKTTKTASVANSYEYGLGVGVNVALSGTSVDADDLSIKSDYDRGFKDGYCLGRNVFNSDDLKLLDGVYEYEQ
ncbi:hypothetical protein [Megasphaera elsdenii]|uniref:hypothetical protein n=1 Tax=Megasphaera elsdenii TaxID=907 RepID=UPI0033970AB3|nr:hypothetical protein [Megasphaera elsdenii]